MVKQIRVKKSIVVGKITEKMGDCDSRCPSTCSCINTKKPGGADMIGHTMNIGKPKIKISR